MVEPVRISVEEAKRKTGNVAILVCAYNDEQKFREAPQPQGAVSLLEFESYLPFISKKHEIIFYCACPNEASAARRAEEYLATGYKNVKVLAGGIEAWKRSGLPLTPF